MRCGTLRFSAEMLARNGMVTARVLRGLADAGEASAYILLVAQL